MNCDTCHWKMSRDGRCQRGQSPDYCSEYMMDPHLRRAMEQQEREHREREERERKERERQEWLKTDEGKKWQAEENRKKEEERLEKERKEREHQKWLASDEGQKWQAEEKLKKEKQRRKETAKKIRNKIVTICIVITIPALIIFAIYRSTGSFFKYKVNDNETLTITGYSGRKDVVIPSAKNGISVTEIGNDAFYGQKIKSIIIPGTVTTIGERAFYNNQLTNIVIPDGVTNIGDYAFMHPGGSGVRLDSVVISDTVTSIGYRAFGHHTPTSIKIGSNVTLNDSFQANFDNTYNDNGKLAGTYYRSGEVNNRRYTRR